MDTTLEANETLSAKVDSHEPLRILTLSCVFPNPSAPEFGIFVQHRLTAMSAAAGVRVLAPVPLFDYSRFKVRWRAMKASAGREIEVVHPRWFYPPMGGASNPIFLALRLLAPVQRIKREWKFHLLDAHFCFPDGIAAALLSKLLNLRFTVTLRGNEPMHARHTLRRALLVKSLRRASLVICVSEELKRFAIEAGVEPVNTAVIPNGIDPSIFFPRDPAVCRRKHNLPLGRLLVLSAGSLIERKGHHRVLQAVAQLRAQGQNVDLIIAGGPGREGNFEQQIRTQIERLGLSAFVRITGVIAPGIMAEMMSAADVLCLASTREGWPNVVHEALACGLPVVSTDVGAVTDLIPSRLHGRVVPRGDSDALRDALADALAAHWDRSLISSWGQARSWGQVGREVLDRMKLLTRDTDRQRR